MHVSTCRGVVTRLYWGTLLIFDTLPIFGIMTQLSVLGDRSK